MKHNKYSLVVKVAKIDDRAILPQQSTSGAVGYDIYSLEEVIFYPSEFKLVRTGLVIKTEPPLVAVLVPRSSLFMRKGLFMPNSIGIIDHDYCGKDDEVKIPLYNLTDDLRKIKAGERIAQLVCFYYNPAPLIEVDIDDLDCKQRGGFGSTGGYK